jgi:hypothetical protein
MTPKSLNFLVNEIIQRHPLLCNGLFIHVSETTHSSTEVVEPLEVVTSIRSSRGYLRWNPDANSQSVGQPAKRSQLRGVCVASMV